AEIRRLGEEQPCTARLSTERESRNKEKDSETESPGQIPHPGVDSTPGPDGDVLSPACSKKNAQFDEIQMQR
ncbi:Hypothetical predicted protein, partial [Pelobates cultripes]